MDIFSRYLLNLLVVVVALAGSTSVATAQQSERLSITRTEHAYVLNVPVSRLEMTIPAANLFQQPPNIYGSTNNPRYFSFSDPRRGLMLSGWFEPASRYMGITGFWKREQNAWNQNGLPRPIDVLFDKIDGWEVVFYQQPVPKGSSSHVRAHFVQADTWIDLHISVTSGETVSTNRSVVESMLKSIVVKEKSGG